MATMEMMVIGMAVEEGRMDVGKRGLSLPPDRTL